MHAREAEIAFARQELSLCVNVLGALCANAKKLTLGLDQLRGLAQSHCKSSQGCCSHSPDVVSEAVLAALAPPPPPAPVLADSGANRNFSSLRAVHMPCSLCMPAGGIKNVLLCKAVGLAGMHSCC